MEDISMALSQVHRSVAVAATCALLSPAIAVAQNGPAPSQAQEVAREAYIFTIRWC